MKRVRARNCATKTFLLCTLGYCYFRLGKLRGGTMYEMYGKVDAKRERDDDKLNLCQILRNFVFSKLRVGFSLLFH